jgi:uncharacterized protein YkwD
VRVKAAVTLGLWRNIFLCSLLAGGAARADIVASLQSLRAGGCGGTTAAAAQLRRNPALDRAAGAWAAGAAPDAALQAAGYAHKALATFHLTVDPTSTDEMLRRVDCHKAADPVLREFGLYQHGAQAWLVLAAARTTTPAGQNTIMVSHPAHATSSAPALLGRQVELINAARARGVRCGAHELGPAPPVHLSAQLSDVALGHATDMARHNYFEHEDLAGHSPADRVRASGYQERLVGENIAYGPTSADEVVRGWLDSPGHCENIMDVRFSEVGLAYAAGAGSKPGLYWVQVFAAPKG